MLFEPFVSRANDAIGDEGWNATLPKYVFKLIFKWLIACSCPECTSSLMFLQTCGSFFFAITPEKTLFYHFLFAKITISVLYQQFILH